MNDAAASFMGGSSTAAIIFILVLAVAGSIVVVTIYHWAVARPRFRSSGITALQTGPEGAEKRDLDELRSRVAALEAASAGALQHVGFVRFNAFADVGSELSYALAAIDGRGNGFLISSIYSREEVRSYAKAVREFATDKDLSAEEQRALDMAVSQAKRRRA